MVDYLLPNPLNPSLFEHCRFWKTDLQKIKDDASSKKVEG